MILGRKLKVRFKDCPSELHMLSHDDLKLSESFDGVSDGFQHARLLEAQLIRIKESLDEPLDLLIERLLLMSLVLMRRDREVGESHGVSLDVGKDKLAKERLSCDLGFFAGVNAYGTAKQIHCEKVSLLHELDDRCHVFLGSHCILKNEFSSQEVFDKESALN